MAEWIEKMDEELVDTKIYDAKTEGYLCKFPNLITLYQTSIPPSPFPAGTAPQKASNYHA
ncbi:hypothetical protein M408DRAFT_204819 [Serendipita vermifera MAFF 305830]|uniref:Uncharacterized protein n=1 Tax=Serendipita vermifera MAFF 305830 TaxID=933852 RepID=A0A0C2WHF3_SERVB|nr:hypothetical protein M408DRAFT_204819 [Serendipita vermifera MAFF 305830]